MRATWIALAGALVIGAAVEPSFVPARLTAAPAFEQPTQTVGGGQVLLEATVGTDGVVTRVDRLRVTPPFGDLLADAVSGWRFAPATHEVGGRRASVETHVLVAGVFRPPALYLGSNIGEVPQTTGAASAQVPSPHELLAPPYSPNARGSAVVILEAEVGADGSTRGIRVVQSGGAFDDAARQALDSWSFDPARRDDEGRVPSYVYAVFGFREPIVK
ncbi:MAG TPA: TonB family protein [Vicinamibacterales bacterium]|nr:TonB family protein [Vicinamibacterales bacterium]